MKLVSGRPDNKKPGVERRANPSRRMDLLAARTSFYPVFVTNLTSMGVWKPGRRTTTSLYRVATVVHYTRFSGNVKCV